MSHCRQSQNEREEIIRSKVHGIYNIDVKTDKVFLDKSQTSTRYDVITTSLCLEAACFTMTEYISAIQNITQLLKEGGHIVISGVLGQTFYRVGDFLFKCFKFQQRKFEMYGKKTDSKFGMENFVQKPFRCSRGKRFFRFQRCVCYAGV